MPDWLRLTHPCAVVASDPKSRSGEEDKRQLLRMYGFYHLPVKLHTESSNIESTSMGEIMSRLLPVPYPYSSFIAAKLSVRIYVRSRRFCLIMLLRVQRTISSLSRTGMCMTSYGQNGYTNAYAKSNACRSPKSECI